MDCFIVEVSDVNVDASRLVLRGDESKHAVQSLRLREGDNILATDLIGRCYKCEIIDIQNTKKNVEVECRIVSVHNEYNEAITNVVLAQGILQSASKLEEIIEKATEYGVASFRPIITVRSEKQTVNKERVERVIKAATKQVSRARMPILASVMDLSSALDLFKKEERSIYILHETADPEKRFSNHARDKKMALVIGPEGGFTDDEVFMAQNDFGAHVVTLGERRLRAEAAAIAAVAITLC